MSKSMPWGKFFWSDYESDEALRLCSFAAQGLWMRCLCLTAKADPTGYLVINGHPLSTTDIARLTGGSEAEVGELLIELERNGVFSRDSKDRVYSRRMVRDVKKASIAKKNGKRGGNPSLYKQTEKPASDNPQDNCELKLRDQKLETRNQKKKETPNGVSKKGTRISKDWEPPCGWVEIAIGLGLPRAKAISELDRFKDYWLSAPGQRGIKLDWEATWRNWVRRTLESIPEADRGKGTDDISALIGAYPNG